MAVTEVWPGAPAPLGATWQPERGGTNFAVYSEHATRVEVCLFDEPTGREMARVALPEQTRHVWHGFLLGVRPGQLYGFRVAGLYAPARGQRFNPAKLLVDPYARALAGRVDWSVPVFGYRLSAARQDLTRDIHNSARGVPKGVVVDPAAFDWQGDRRPMTPLSESVIYEAHVKGLTKLRRDIPEPLRGTYAGLAHPAILEYLRELGVTAVELLPIHQFVDDKFLLDRGLRNYWGYSTLAYFAPDARYASSGARGQQVQEFKAMVRALHAAGIEVLLDVVYNHTAEGSHLGPTLSFRGMDNQTYYHLNADQPRFYWDVTGTGNSVKAHHPQTLKLILDSLRYWVQEMHVDGFRFDLATTLGRDPRSFDPAAGFFDALHQDPLLSTVKLIAEPWDVGESGYQVGNFPIAWSEWNGKFRDNVRRFWKGDMDQVADLATHLAGSSYLYAAGGRGPQASVNFITSHDGFTLRDLVSYNEKHNQANGENNLDGDDHNQSWNCGEEGPTSNPAIATLRARQQRNFLATLFLSQGVPMLLAGDELGRTQAGNNNAYCQDNELSWLSWELDAEQRNLLAFTRRLIQLRRDHPVLRRRRFFTGRMLEDPDVEFGIRDATWLRLDGEEMAEQDWANGLALSLGVRLAGNALDERDERGQPIEDDTLLLLLNAYHDELPFVLPEAGRGSIEWEVLLDTRHPTGGAPEQVLGPCVVGDEYPLGGRTLALLRRVPPAPGTLAVPRLAG